jgi:hypothetical protein
MIYPILIDKWREENCTKSIHSRSFELKPKTSFAAGQNDIFAYQIELWQNTLNQR